MAQRQSGTVHSVFGATRSHIAQSHTRRGTPRAGRTSALPDTDCLRIRPPRLLTHAHYRPVRRPRHGRSQPRSEGGGTGSGHHTYVMKTLKHITKVALEGQITAFLVFRPAEPVLKSALSKLNTLGVTQRIAQQNPICVTVFDPFATSYPPQWRRSGGRSGEESGLASSRFDRRVKCSTLNSPVYPGWFSDQAIPVRATNIV